MQRAANDGASVRNAVSGQCAACGVLAVDLAASGTTGHPSAFEIVYGDILGEEFRPDLVSRDDEPYLPRGYFKLHACSRWNHAAIEATEMLVNEEGLSAEDVAAIVVATFAPATRLSDRRPRNGFAARHSIPYAVAARLVYGSNGLEQYSDEAVKDERVQELASRVTVVEDPELTRQTPLTRAARVEVATRAGRLLARTADRIPGGPESPYPTATLHAKARSLLTRSIGAAGAADLVAFVLSLPEHRTLSGLREILASAYGRQQ
jgi:2-methylcitrate dehydratase PrpD